MSALSALAYLPTFSKSVSTTNVSPAAAGAYNQMRGDLRNQYTQDYAPVIAGYANLYNQAQEQVANYGQTEKIQLANQFAQNQAQQRQGLMSRGLGNTTIQNSVDTGLLQSQQLASTNLNEQIAQYRTNVLGQFGSQLYGAMGHYADTQQTAQERLGEMYLGLLGRATTTTTQNTSFAPRGGVGGGGGGGGGGGYGGKFTDPAAGGFIDPGPGYNPSATIPIGGGFGQDTYGGYGTYVGDAGGFSGAGDFSGGGDF